MKQISARQLALSFTGMFLGAGFVSGQELWQFFACFGPMGLLGFLGTAALFVVASALNVRCGSCFTAVWNQEREKAGLFMKMTEDTSGAVKVGIEAMKRIIAADKAKK